MTRCMGTNLHRNCEYSREAGPQASNSYAGSMHNETKYFLRVVAYERPAMVRKQEALQVMEVYTTGDLSAKLGEPVMLPIN